MTVSSERGSAYDEGDSPVTMVEDSVCRLVPMCEFGLGEEGCFSMENVCWTSE